MKKPSPTAKPHFVFRGGRWWKIETGPKGLVSACYAETNWWHGAMSWAVEDDVKSGKIRVPGVSR